MQKFLLYCAVILGPLFAASQPPLKLTQYSIHSRLNSECTSGVTLTLFDASEKKDTLNQIILWQLLGNLNAEEMIRLEELYLNSNFDGNDRPFLYNVSGTSTFAHNGLYSFIACPFNACDHAPRSNYETSCLTIDTRGGKILSLNDLIDPAKRDTFEKFVYKFVTRYRIRNVPTCFVSMSAPLEVKSSNSVVSATDSVKIHPGILEKFYLKDQSLVVYNKAEHRDYQFKCVELTLPLQLSKPFLRPGIAERLGI